MHDVGGGPSLVGLRLHYTVKKLSFFPVPSPDVINQTFPAGNNSGMSLTKLSLAGNNSGIAFFTVYIKYGNADQLGSRVVVREEVLLLPSHPFVQHA